MVDVVDSKSIGGDTVRVQVPPPAYNVISLNYGKNAVIKASFFAGQI